MFQREVVPGAWAELDGLALDEDLDGRSATGARPHQLKGEVVPDEPSGWLGVKKTTMANKARLIRDTLRLRDFDSEFMRRDLVEATSLAWLMEVDGMVVDIRHAPAQLQVRAFELGLIPFVPGVAGDRP